MIVLAAVLLAIFLLALVPAGVRVHYDEEGLTAWIAVGAVRFRVYPLRSKEPGRSRTSRGRPRATKKKQKKPRESRPEQSGKPGSLAAFKPYLKLGCELFGKFRRKLRVRELTAYVWFGGKDAAATAVAYGRAWAVLGALTATLENLFVIEKRDICAKLDYTKEKMELQLRMDLRMRLGTMAILGFQAVLRLLKLWLHQKKAVQKNEPSSL